MSHAPWTPIPFLQGTLPSARYVCVGHLPSLPWLSAPAVWFPSADSGVLGSRATQPRGLGQHPREHAPMASLRGALPHVPAAPCVLWPLR